MNGASALILLAGMLTSPGDTLVDVQEGEQLVLRDFGGTVVLESWTRPVIRAEVDSKEAPNFQVSRSGNRVELRMPGGRTPVSGEDFRLTIPQWMDVEISGKEVEVEVYDVSGDVTVRNFRGDLFFQDLSGSVDAYTAEGSIEGYGLTGTAHLQTGEDEIVVVHSTAILDLETVDGDIRLEGMESRRISVRTTDGEIEFSGRVLEGGDYGFYSHGGDIQIRLAEPVDLDARVLAYGGEFQSDFPVRTKGFRSGESLDFTLGSGGARMVVETFDGEVSLLRGSSGTREQ